MLVHRALGRDLESLSVTVIDNKAPMLSVMRAMLAAIGVGQIDVFDDPAQALSAMHANVPDLVIAEAGMQPLSGCDLVRAMRAENCQPLCFVPAIIMSAQARPSLVEEALNAGAHQVLVLPTSASTLYRRLDWLLNDDRPYEGVDGHYVIANLAERVALSHHRPPYMKAPADAPALRKSSQGGEGTGAERPHIRQKPRAAQG